MAKREYIQANKEWLEAKAKENGVKALPNVRTGEKARANRERDGM